MTREDLLEMACKTLLREARATVAAQERNDYWSQFGTDSPTARRADARHTKQLALLEAAEEMARQALRGNVTLFLEAAQRHRDEAGK